MFLKNSLLSLSLLFPSLIAMNHSADGFDRIERKNRYIPIDSEIVKKPKQEGVFKKIFFVSECLLNQNIRAQGVKNIEGEGPVSTVVQKIISLGAGITVVPCPEIPYEGLKRWACGRKRYDNDDYRALCKKHAEEYVLKKILAYKECGYLVGGFICVNGSPSCASDYCFGGYCAGKCDQPGIFIEELQKELIEKGLHLKFIGYDKWHKEQCLKNMDEAFSTL